MKLLGLLIFLAITYEIHSAATRFCGENLAQVLNAMCIYGFNTKEVDKRNSNKLIHHKLLDLNGLNDIEDNTDSLLNDWLFSEALGTLAKTRRHRQLPGVYDECCRKGCSLDELIGYCRPAEETPVKDHP